jgi:hypothetical protein
VVPEGYRYYQKLVTPEEDLSLANVYLKWYNIYPPEEPITAAQIVESRTFVAAEAERLQFADELGVVLLHRVESGLLLLVTTWRNTNEIWESAYAKEAAQAQGFASIGYPQSHRATFCVWELGPLWHERQAWTRFLSSERDEQAKLAYINDRYSGLV